MKMLTCPKRRLLCTGAESISTVAATATTSGRRDCRVVSATPTDPAMATTAAHVATSQIPWSTPSLTAVIGHSTRAANGG